MSEPELPTLWRTLLAEAAAAPDGVLSLKEDPRGEVAVEAAERLTDLGLLRIVTARRYRLSEAGRAAIAAQPAERRGRSRTPEATPPTDAGAGPDRKSFWSRLFGSR